LHVPVRQVLANDLDRGNEGFDNRGGAKTRPRGGARMTRGKQRHPVYGLMAEFDRPEPLIAAARRARDAGHTRMDAYSPYPVEGLAGVLGFKRTMVPIIVLIGGVVGCIGGFLLQYWLSGSYYPLNIGGRPLNSWPAFIPITFELTVLIAALSAVLGM